MMEYLYCEEVASTRSQPRSKEEYHRQSRNPNGQPQHARSVLNRVTLHLLRKSELDLLGHLDDFENIEFNETYLRLHFKLQRFNSNTLSHVHLPICHLNLIF
jgi:hypothetical protein